MTKIPLTVYSLHLADRILFIKKRFQPLLSAGLPKKHMPAHLRLGDDFHTHLVQHFARAEKASAETARDIG